MLQKCKLIFAFQAMVSAPDDSKQGQKKETMMDSQKTTGTKEYLDDLRHTHRRKTGNNVFLMPSKLFTMFFSRLVFCRPPQGWHAENPYSFWV